MSLRIGAIAFLAMLGLAACGNTRTERVVTGAAGGAAAGAAIAEDPLTGAAAGGLVGAVR